MTLLTVGGLFLLWIYMHIMVQKVLVIQEKNVEVCTGPDSSY